MQKTRRQIEQISSSNYAFICLQQIECDQDDANEAVYNIIQSNRFNLSPHVQERVNRVVYRGFQDVLAKFEADVVDIEAIPDDECDYVVLTNRRIESTFSHWKHNQKNFINLLNERNSAWSNKIIWLIS